MSEATLKEAGREGAGVVELEGERAYPIYYLSARWMEPEGDNVGGVYHMWEDHPDAATVTDRLRKLVGGYAERREVGYVLHLEAEYKLHETWCVTWFQHWTFDTGQSDSEALASFRRYVDRHAWYQDDYSSEQGKEIVRERMGHDPIVLMGAEDRYRWCGTEDGSSDHEKRTDPPCRCEHCQEQGVIRIGH